MMKDTKLPAQNSMTENDLREFIRLNDEDAVIELFRQHAVEKYSEGLDAGIDLGYKESMRTL